MAAANDDESTSSSAEEDSTTTTSEDVDDDGSSSSNTGSDDDESGSSSSSKSGDDVDMVTAGDAPDASSTPASSSTVTTANVTTVTIDDAGSSRLFQAHRTLGLLTASSPPSLLLQSVGLSPSARLFTGQRGKFHLEPGRDSSDDAFVTVPLGDRFQILRADKLLPALVGRALPPSAKHHHSRRRKKGDDGEKNCAEDMHRAVADASLSVTVATHGPGGGTGGGGRAVSATLYHRTRPIASIDAFPFLASKKGGSKDRWGIVDVVNLGKIKVDMDGEKEGKAENALLLALICARGDDEEKEASKEEEGRKRKRRGGGQAVEVVGDDSDDDDMEEDDDDDEEEDGSSDSSADSESSSSDDDDDEEDDDDRPHHNPPSAQCRGRIILVQASRTTLLVRDVVDLPDEGAGAGFVPYMGVHPATYVNKIVLGGRTVGAKAAKSSSATSMLLLNIRSGRVIHSFRCLDDENAAATTMPIITAMEQSPAIDTIAVGTSTGDVHLVNLKQDVNLFSLRHGRNASKANKTKRGRKAAAPTAVSSLSFRTDGNATKLGIAPLAVGCDDGSINVWDLTPKTDDDDDSRRQKKKNATAVTRRTLLTRMEHAHHGGISRLAYMPGEPLLLSTGTTSNAIVVHVFDAPDHSGRTLRSRRGHAAPPSLLRYLVPGGGGGGILAGSATDGTDAMACQVLSCGGEGDRSLRTFSSARTALDKEYSQGKGIDAKAKAYGHIGPAGRAEFLLPTIVGMARGEARSRDWGDLVTIHRDHAMAYVWSTKRGAQSGPVLRQEHWNVSKMKEQPPRTANATSVTVSSCGNFCLVGTLGGTVYKYNLQSGLSRGSYPRDEAKVKDNSRKQGDRFAGDVGRTMRQLDKMVHKHGGTAPSDADQAALELKGIEAAEAARQSYVARASHTGAVVGIAVDSLNRTVVTAGADGKIVLWNFKTHMPHRKQPVALPGPATKMCHVRDSDLAAVATEDGCVVVFDCSTLSIVRYLGGRIKKKGGGTSLHPHAHSGPITDMGFGPDGRKLFTSSLDGTIRVWDVPTGSCVDWMAFESPPTSLAISPTGEFLATSHVNRLGISLWCDKSFFRTVHLDGGSPSEPTRMDEPCPVAECEALDEEDRVGDGAALASLLALTGKKAGDDDDDYANDDAKGRGDKGPPTAKRDGLITMSGLPPGHWKNLFHLELVKERNKPKQAPTKPPQAPFFLQWRGDADNMGEDAAVKGGESKDAAETDGKKAEEKWDAAWSDDDDGDDGAKDAKDDTATKADDEEESDAIVAAPPSDKKRRKIAHHRSKLAEILQSCHDRRAATSSPGTTYDEVTRYMSKMGPSAIDVEISSLCHGIHDADDGLPLLRLAALWLLECCESRLSFEAVNAYLHRFLHVHANAIAGIEDEAAQKKEHALGGGEEGDDEDEDDPLKRSRLELVSTIARLRAKQRAASNKLHEKMQHTICLLRHFSRMV